MFAYIPDSNNNLVSSEAGTAIPVGTAAYSNPTLLIAAAPGYNPAVYTLQQNLDLQRRPDRATTCTMPAASKRNT